jgi:SAM-dependent methyltransferase
MRETLLEILREPTTSATFDLEVTARGRRGHVEEGRLVSKETGRAYPIVAGIPRFAPIENYTDSFGLQWNRFRDVQLDSNNARSGWQNSIQRFDAEAGWNANSLGGKWVLDAGCGAGRFAEIAADRGANLVALDYSSAVDAAARTLDHFENVDVVQGSVLDPPFAPSSFDFAYCIGVVQHTPAPRVAVAKVVSLVKSGGEFCFTIYARQPWTKLNGKYLVRPITKRLPPRALLSLIEGCMPILFPLTDKLFRLPVLGKAVRFAIPVANYVDAIEDRDLRYRTAILDTFDMLSPKHDDPMTFREVQNVLEAAAAVSFDFRTRAPINVVGVR